MKPRLEPVPFTDEDYEVLEFLVRGYPGYEWEYALLNRSFAADRRDAYIMLFLESSKSMGCHQTLTRAGQLYGFIGSFVRIPAAPPREDNYA